MQSYAIFEDTIKGKESLLIKKEKVLEMSYRFMANILPEELKEQYIQSNL